MTLGELADRLYGVDEAEYPIAHVAASRLEAIERAWAELERYMGVIGRTHYLRDCDASRIALAAMDLAITGTTGSGEKEG
jgi:hypothetical protein